MSSAGSSPAASPPIAAPGPPSQARAPSLADRLESEFCPPVDSSLLAALLLDLPAEPSAEDEHQIRVTLGAIAAQVELEQIQAQFSQDEDRLKYDGSTASSSGLNSLAGDVRSGTASRNGGNSTDSTSLLSEVERTLEEWRINDEAWEKSRFGSEPSSGSEDGRAEGERPRLSPASSDAPPARSDDPFEFLVSMFPKVSFATISDKLASGQDLEAIMDELMTEDFIKNDELETTPKKAPPPVKKHQKRKGPKDAFVVSLTDVLHRPPSPNLNHRKPGAISTVTPQAAAWASAPSSENHWAAADSRSSHLASLTHVTTARVTSLLHVNGNSQARALAALLNQLRNERPRLKGPDDAVDQLRLLMPGLSTDRYQLLLSATEDDISDAMDLQAFIGQTEVDGGAPLARAELIADPQLGKSVQVSHAKKTGPGSALYDHSARTSPLVGSAALPTVIVGKAPRGNEFNPESYSYEECTAFAQEYLAKRNHEFRAAARAFQRGNNAHESGIAFHHAETGREHDAQKRKWEARAARALVRQRRVHDASTIDLHNLTVHHALSQVRDSCNTWWNSSPSGTPAMPLRIVTGAGNHSKGQAVLLPAVTKLLDREGWRWKYDVKTNSMMSGPGAVLVTGAVTRR